MGAVLDDFCASTVTLEVVSTGDHARDTALVLEGGGYRAVFTAGVLDVLMERGVCDFSSVWGASAGALCSVSLKSHQIGRSIRIMLAYRDDRHVMSLFSLVTTGDATGDYLYHTVQETVDPCDVATFNANPMRMFCVASDMVLGTPRYFEVRTLPDDVEMVKASSALPVMSTPVEIEGHRYLDGGTADSVPIEVALGISEPKDVVDYTPAGRAVVVLTQHREYVRTRQFERLMMLSRRYQHYPSYVELLSTRAERYMRQRELLWELERQGRILILAPAHPVSMHITEHSGEPMLDLYVQGRAAAWQRFDEITKFLR